MENEISEAIQICYKFIFQGFQNWGNLKLATHDSDSYNRFGCDTNDTSPLRITKIARFLQTLEPWIDF